MSHLRAHEVVAATIGALTENSWPAQAFSGEAVFSGSSPKTLRCPELFPATSAFGGRPGKLSAPRRFFLPALRFGASGKNSASARPFSENGIESADRQKTFSRREGFWLEPPIRVVPRKLLALLGFFLRRRRKRVSAKKLSSGTSFSPASPKSGLLQENLSDAQSFSETGPNPALSGKTLWPGRFFPGWPEIAGRRKKLSGTRIFFESRRNLALARKSWTVTGIFLRFAQFGPSQKKARLTQEFSRWPFPIAPMRPYIGPYPAPVSPIGPLDRLKLACHTPTKPQRSSEADLLEWADRRVWSIPTSLAGSWTIAAWKTARNGKRSGMRYTEHVDSRSLSALGSFKGREVDSLARPACSSQTEAGRIASGNGSQSDMLSASRIGVGV